MQPIKVIIAANVSYGDNTFNTPLLIEYKHTGKQFFKKANHFTVSEEIANDWRKAGKKVIEKSGYYFMSRLAIPTIKADGTKDWWYINNEGDCYKLNKVSKYGQKIHSLLSENINPFQQL